MSMNTRDFLGRVLGDTGYYCVFGLNTSRAKRVQKFYTSIDAALDCARAFDANGLDAYFALATFEEDGRRTKDNAQQLRSLFLDLDCGPGKPFADQSEALGALRDFCKELKLPKPLIVNSGRGLHVYWALEKPMAAAEWLPLAQGLKRACAANDFEADSDVTADAARILRVPGTHNYKSDTPAPVEILAGGKADVVSPERFKTALNGYAHDITDMFSGNSLMGTTTSTTERLLSSKESVFKTIVQKTMSGKGCGQLRNIIENQANIAEPLWRAGLSIAKFCSDSVKAAHAISRHHPGYDPEETEAKMNRAVGPYTCEKFDDLNPGVCGDCPLRGKFKSPIAIGMQIVEDREEDRVVEAENADTGEAQTFTIPGYPKPYFRGQAGGVFVKVSDDDGDSYDDCVYLNDLYFVRRVYDPHEGESLVARLHLPRDGVREFTVTLGQATSPDELRKVLSARGVVANSKKAWEKIMVYSNSWVSHLQSNTVADTAHQQFGWTDDEKLDCFVLGHKEIHADKIEYNPPTTATAALMPAFKPAGTLEGWTKQANFFNRSGMEPLQFMLCMTLASPIMALTPYNAAMFTLYSDGSGHGKTTVQKIALAAFGDPSLLLLQADDTVNFRMNRLEVLKNLPAQWDEVTNIEPKVASSMLYQVQTGKQKGRMSSGSNAERITGRQWKLACGFTSNESLLSKIRNIKAQAEGEPHRILEYHAQAYNFADKTETDVLSKAVGKHYGHVGVPLVQYIIQNKAEVSKLIDAVQKQIDTAAELKPKDRFWSTTAAVTVTAAMIAKKLGFVDYDPKALRDWAIQLIKENKRQQIEKRVSIETHVTNYVAENYGNILWIKSTEDRRGQPTSGDGLDSLVTPEQNPRIKFVARFETDTKMLYLVMKPFQEWCANQHLNYDSVINEVVEKMGGGKQRVRLGKGTKLNLPTVTALAVNCRDLDIDDGSSDA